MNSIKTMIEISPALRASAACYNEHFVLLKNGVINLYDNVIDRDIDLIPNEILSQISQIQFAREFNVSTRTFQIIERLIKFEISNVWLRLILNGAGAIKDLSCLEYLPSLKCANIDFIKNENIDEFNKYCRFEKLGIGCVKGCVSLEKLAVQSEIKSLGLRGQFRDIRHISNLPFLEKLDFTSVPMQNYTELIGCSRLTTLSFFLGSATNYSALPDIGAISKLSFERVRQLKSEHLNPLKSMPYLQTLELITQPHLNGYNINNVSVKIRKR
jgi:hypothetical protein